MKIWKERFSSKEKSPWGCGVGIEGVEFGITRETERSQYGWSEVSEGKEANR